MENAPADYHGTMTADIFENCFENSLLKRLNESSVIVTDNAKYHSRVLDPKTNMSWRKDDVIEYERTTLKFPTPSL